MWLLDLTAKGWGKDSWSELSFSEKSFTIFIIFDIMILTPFIILDLLDISGLI